MSTASNYDPDLAQAIEDFAPIAIDLRAAEKRRDALSAAAPDAMREAINLQIEDLLGVIDTRAARLAIDPDALRLIVDEMGRLAALGEKPAVRAVERALSDMLAVATTTERNAHVRRTRAQNEVEDATRQRVAAGNALAAFQALHA